MGLTNFRAYQISLEFYWECQKFKCARHLGEQLLRASSSVTLNLAEGSGKPTPRDRARFYFIALGSLRECEAILDLSRAVQDTQIKILCDRLGSHLYQLCKSQSNPEKLKR